VVRRQRGGYLLKEPETVMQIYSRIREAVACPVTMKLRTGYDSSRQSYDNFYQIVSEASEQNVDALIIHARTVVQKFTGEVDWPFLEEIKQHFPKTTFIGSGDLFEPQITIERLKSSNLDGILIARGAIGNPWIYTGLHSVLKGEPVRPAPDLNEQAEVIKRHFEMISRLYAPIKAIRYFRKFLVRYCRLHPRRKQAQKTLLAAGSKTQLLAGIERWYENHEAAKGKEDIH
jgi:tRNA-dihydrouridine synthase